MFLNRLDSIAPEAENAESKQFACEPNLTMLFGISGRPGELINQHGFRSCVQKERQSGFFNSLPAGVDNSQK